MRTLVLLALVALSITGCEKPPTTCDNYCDMQIEAASQNAENKKCSVYPDALDDFEDNCLSTCNNVLNHVVQRRVREEADTCLKCIYTTVENPSSKSIAEAREECYAICNNLGGYQFFYTFYITQPAWDCSERDGKDNYWETRI